MNDRIVKKVKEIIQQCKDDNFILFAIYLPAEYFEIADLTEFNMMCLAPVCFIDDIPIYYECGDKTQVRCQHHYFN